MPLKEEFVKLRELTRHRANLLKDIINVKNRIQRSLEDGNIKLKSAISNIFGVAGRKVLKAILEGETDLSVLATFVDTNVKAKREVIKKSLTHTLDETNFFLLNSMYTQLLYLEYLAEDIEKKIDEKMEPYNKFIEKLDAIPGIDKKTAQIIIAEGTTDMHNFKDAKSFAAWSGVASGNHESAGKKKEQNTPNLR